MYLSFHTVGNTVLKMKKTSRLKIRKQNCLRSTNEDDRFFDTHQNFHNTAASRSSCGDTHTSLQYTAALVWGGPLSTPNYFFLELCGFAMWSFLFLARPRQTLIKPSWGEGARENKTENVANQYTLGQPRPPSSHMHVVIE